MIALSLQETRGIGVTDDAILNYLRVSWITPEEHKRLALEQGGETSSVSKRLLVAETQSLC